MPLRRAFYVWQFVAVLMLPLWLVVGYGVSGHGGWGFLGLVVTLPIVAFVLLVLACIVAVRPRVRREKAVSAPDVVVLSALHVSLVGLGFYGRTATLFVSLAIAASVVAFWFVLWEIVRDASAARRREENGPSSPKVNSSFSEAPSSRSHKDGPVIVVHEYRDHND